MIQKINPVSNAVFINNTQALRIMSFASDSFYCENKNINKAPLVERGIVSSYESINRFYDDISKDFFKDDKKAFEFASYLKRGDIGLSSSILSKNNISAFAIGFKDDDCLDKIQKHVEDGVGLGLNFSNFNKPIDEIKRINFHYNARKDNFKRPPAFIGLLNVDNKYIDDFINLKTKERFCGWCFDLSVVIDDNFMNKVFSNDRKALKTYNLLLNAMAKTGEPGIIFSNDKNYHTDCCAAVELKENQGFSIASINLSNMYKKGKVDYSYLQKCAGILSSAMKRFDNSYVGILGYDDLLDKMGLEYGSASALDVLNNCLSTIKKECDKNGINMAISPTGTVCRVLKTSPSIEPKKIVPINAKIDTLEVAYKYLSGKGQISTTINLKKPEVEEIDYIVKSCYKKGIKGITVYPNE